MHDIKLIRENPEAFNRALVRRGPEVQATTQHLMSIDESRRAIIRVAESWKARHNAASKAIGQAKAKKDEATVQTLMAEVAECKKSLSTLEEEEKAVGKELMNALLQ